MSRAWTGVVAFAVVALGAAALYFIYTAKQNRDAAGRWESKAGTLERTLTARTRQLNTRTDALNKTAAALKRSENDVDDLESRQRTLANEKAQVEDARGALELQATSLATIATEQGQCTSQLTELAEPLRGRGLRVDRRQRSHRQRHVRAGPERLRHLPAAVRRRPVSKGLGIFALAALALVVAAAAALGYKTSPQPLQTTPPKVKHSPRTPATPSTRSRRSSPRTRVTRAAERMTLRVRNISCAGIATGSGFAVDEHTIITNRHVIEGAAVLELNTWDGTSIDADVDEAQTGRLVDIGVTKVAAELPQVADLGDDPKPGDKVTAVGYPLGGPLTLSPGRVIRTMNGRDLPQEVAFDAPGLGARHPHQARQLRRPAPEPQGPGRRRHLRRPARHHAARTSCASPTRSRCPRSASSPTSVVSSRSCPARSLAGMSAYVIAEMEVHDPERYEQYKDGVPATLEASGGRFVVRGGEVEHLEGDWQPKRVVVIEFDDLAALKAWWDSPDYRQVKKLREGAATLSVIAVEGVNAK